MHVHMKPLQPQQLPAPVRVPPKPVTPLKADVQRLTQRQDGSAGRDECPHRRRPGPRRQEEPAPDRAHHDPATALATALVLLDLGIKADEQRPNPSVCSTSSLDELLSGALSTRDASTTPRPGRDVTPHTSGSSSG